MLTAALLEDGARTVTFCRSRKATEVVAGDVRRRLDDDLASRVRSYRGGYLPIERREIETELFDGQLAGVVATTALELGIDVGGLDACVIDGFPGTVASMRQQAGRAGRTAQRSLAVLVAGSDQLDQWLMAHPREVFTRPPEPAVVNLSNPFVLLPHLACAAYEAPLSLDDERWWGEDLGEGVRQLVLGDRLVLRNRRAVWSGRGAPARASACAPARPRSTASPRTTAVSSARSTERVRSRRCTRVRSTCIRASRSGSCRSTSTTEPPSSSRSTTTSTRRCGRRRTCRSCRRRPTRAIGRVQLHLGAVQVTSHVVGYDRRDARTHTSLGREPLDLPPTRLVTRAFWYTVGPDVLAAARLSPEQVPGTLHAVEHAGIGILPLFTICDRWDVGGCLHGIPRRLRRARRSSSTTATPAAPASPSSATAPDAGTSKPRSLSSSGAPAALDVRRACRARSAATATSRSTRPALSRCSARCLPDQSGSIRIDTVPVTRTSPSNRPMIGTSVESV